MGAIGGDELSRWEKMQENGGDRGGGGGARGREEKILVSVRLRPLNEKELANKDPCDWECINDTTIIFRNSLPERSMFPIAYSYDRVFSCDTNTKRVYEEGAKDIALSVVGGINSSIFAYGQTSSGKTYTMYGITEYSVADIYDYIQRHQERAFVMKFSAIEIYNEAVKDLLSNDPTPLRLLDDPEKGTVVEKLTEETLRDSDHLKELLAVCEAQRQVGETSLNETSSRSHQILRLTIESSAREFLGKDNSSTLAASVNFVDLAGSERASQAMSAGTRLKEGCHINRSLLTLGTVIRKLSKGKNGHIPYRDSKLTRILQPSLGGNARSAIICTMSPARSHIEQSRNTLLFATCAKEVVNSAHVNVVMSDKALVKHLQKELARLETELKYPGPPSNVSHTEALLKEKDAQIRKMEKEIKELVQQRDLVQSRLENLLLSVGDDQVARHWDSNQPPRFLANTFQDDNSVSGASPTTHRDPDFHATKFTPPDFANDSEISSEHEYQNSEKPNEEENTSERLLTSSQNFVLLLQQPGEEDVTSCGPEVEDLCKEVRCIEMDETSTSRSETLLAKGDDLVSPSEELRNGGNPSSCAPEESVCTLEQQLQNAKRAADRIEKQHHSEFEQSLWPLEKDVCNSRSSVLARSSSCRPTLSHNSPSPWFVDENCENTPPSRSLREFAGRPGGPSRRIMSLNFTAESARNSGEGSQSSDSGVSTEVIGRKRVKTTSDEDIASIGEFVAGMKEMAQIQFHKHADGKEAGGRDNGHSADQQLVKDVSIDPMLNPVESPSRWPFEFGKQQQEVIILWHECYVSLVHRTYFFLLFKGDPADSFYMEVELRRLSFLKRMFAAGNAHKSMVDDPETPASSIKALRREREMLSRRMQKKLTSEERDTLYHEWGIPLDSKQRRLQLARLLWSDTKNMDRIKESASIVAKLVDLLEPGQELKEMFGLSFTPQKSNRRSYSWKI